MSKKISRISLFKYKYLKGMNVHQLARHFETSAKTICKFLNLWKLNGIEEDGREYMDLRDKAFKICYLKLKNVTRKR